jgi:hypothetical protein
VGFEVYTTAFETIFATVFLDSDISFLWLSDECVFEVRTGKPMLRFITQYTYSKKRNFLMPPVTVTSALTDMSL